jgi:NAD-dependent SIR2 family protein deacetylase
MLMDCIWSLATRPIWYMKFTGHGSTHVVSAVVIVCPLKTHCSELTQVKRDVILFGEALIPGVISAAITAAEEADLILAIGTQLNVTPAANVVTRGKAAGAKVVIMNNQPTDRDRYANAFLMGDITEMLPALVAIPD